MRSISYSAVQKSLPKGHIEMVVRDSNAKMDSNNTLFGHVMRRHRLWGVTGSKKFL